MRADVQVDGFCDPKFGPVRDAFLMNFSQRGEIGASLCVYLDGRPVIDLWGGHADAARRHRWQQDTIVCMMSVTKAMTALCAHRLIQRGLLDLEAPVSRYWPEFAQNGKEAISVDCLLSHRAALIFPDEAPDNALPRWDVMTAALARQAPAWVPDTRGAYHSSTYGHLIGELIQRVAGRPFVDALRDEITGPLGADFFLGAPAGWAGGIADVVVDPDTVSTRLISTDVDVPLSRAWKPLPRQADVFNSTMWRTSLLPSANGHGNARAAARIFAALIGEVHGVRLLSPDMVDLLREERWFEPCGLTGRRYRFGRGVALNNAPYHPMGPNPRAFGHAGVGGSFVFADPEAGLSFAYAMNHTAAGEGVGNRPEALVETLYARL